MKIPRCSVPREMADNVTIESHTLFLDGTPTVQDLIDKLSTIPKDTKVNELRLHVDKVHSRIFVGVDNTIPEGKLTVYPPNAESNPIVVTRKD